MDLRVVKTKKAIKDAFMELRQKMPLEHIKVKDICEIALINKTTFYKYYEDVFDLSRQLEDECIEKIRQRTEGYSDCLFTDPDKFFEGFLSGPGAPKDDPDDECIGELMVLFRGREWVLKDRMKEHLISNYIKDDMSDEEKVKLYFIMNGVTATLDQLGKNQEIPLETARKVFAELIKKLIS